MEQMQYNLLFRPFVGLGVDGEEDQKIACGAVFPTNVWVPTMFTKNRDRLMTTRLSRNVMSTILAHREVASLLSDEHFSGDGTLIKAWASMKNFQPKVEGTQPDNDGSDDPPAHDPGPDAQLGHPKSEGEPKPKPHPSRRTRNIEVDFKGKKRPNATHASTLDPKARLYTKPASMGAVLCFMGGCGSENGPGDRFPDDGADGWAGCAIGPRNPPQGHGMIVQGDLT